MTTNTTTKDQLLKELANATTTYYEAGGHHKAKMNEMRCEEYKQQLAEMGEEIPSDEELLKIGVFNGAGSY